MIPTEIGYIPIVFLLEKEGEEARWSHRFLMASRLYVQWREEEGGGRRRGRESLVGKQEKQEKQEKTCVFTGKNRKN